MKFYLHRAIKGSNNHYTYSLLERLIQVNGHELETDPDRAEFHLVSLCDVTQLSFLEKVRKNYATAKIIVGGHFAVNFVVCSLFADLVNTGHAFEFFKCRSFDEMARLESVYFKGKKEIIRPSTFIDWSQLPVVQTSDRMFYYLGGAGCKNKCRFCLTSWTNKHQSNSEMRIRIAESKIPKGARLNIISNEYDRALRKSPVKDMMLKDFLSVRKKTTHLVRMGLEFATPESRKKYGKAFPDDAIYQAIDLAGRLKIEIQLFCIGGIDPREAWDAIFDRLPIEPKSMPRIYFKFTNLQYEQFTPMFKERFNMNPENYLDGQFGKYLFNRCAVYNKRVRIFPIASPCLAFWRMGTSLSVNMDQYEAWKALKKEKDQNTVYDALFSTKVIETDYQDKIKFWWQK